jgi:hypothetical protein
MRKQNALVFISLSVALAFCPHLNAGQNETVDMTEPMKKSLVYLKVSSYGYEQYEPWKHTDVSERGVYGCAVGEYQVLTTAWNAREATFIKARRYAKNEFISAKIKVIDYESNLCLIELDPNEMTKPLKPLKFTEDYEKGSRVDFYYLSSGGHLYNGRGYLDHAKISESTVSHSMFLNYVIGNISRTSGKGQVYCLGANPIGIGCWSNKENKESGVIPAETINRFLADIADGEYNGFGAVGFKVSELLDPTVRSFLKMPPSQKTGVHVTNVHNLGTGSDVLKKDDVILTIDDKSLNPYGRFLHSKYERLSYHYLITSKAAGDEVSFDIWRNGEKIQLQAEVKNFSTRQMLVPYHEIGRQPEYIVTAGFVFQKLTRPYLMGWGDDWTGKVMPHLFHYYRNLAFKPTPERSDIVILSYILPTNINLGYQNLRQIVVKKFNGMTIRSIADILTAQERNPDSKYDVVEFELDNPVIVIDRDQLPAANMLISRNYGIRKLVNVNQ